MQLLSILLPCLALMSSSRVVLAAAAAVPPPASLSGRQQEDVVVVVPAPVHQNNNNEGAAPEPVVIVVQEAPRARAAALLHARYENSCPNDDRPHPLCSRRTGRGSGLGIKVGCVRPDEFSVPRTVDEHRAICEKMRKISWCCRNFNEGGMDVKVRDGYIPLVNPYIYLYISEAALGDSSNTY